MNRLNHRVFCCVGIINFAILIFISSSCFAQDVPPKCPQEFPPTQNWQSNRTNLALQNVVDIEYAFSKYAWALDDQSAEELKAILGDQALIRVCLRAKLSESETESILYYSKGRDTISGPGPSPFAGKDIKTAHVISNFDFDTFSVPGKVVVRAKMIAFDQALKSTVVPKDIPGDGKPKSTPQSTSSSSNGLTVNYVGDIRATLTPGAGVGNPSWQFDSLDVLIDTLDTSSITAR